MTLREGGSVITTAFGVVYATIALVTPESIRAYGQEILGFAVLASSAYLIFMDRRAAAKRKIERDNEEAHKDSLRSKNRRLKAENADLIARLHNAGIEYESPIDASDTVLSKVSEEFPAVKP